MVHDDMVALPAGHRSLAYGSDDPVPGGLLAQSRAGGVRVRPAEGRSVYFGRNYEEVHVGIGVHDRRVSRRQGMLTRRGERWWVVNTGHRPIRLPNSRWLHRDGEQVPLATGYTPLFVPGSGVREHLLELYVVGSGRTVATWPATCSESGLTARPVAGPLSADERLVVVVLGQRYLRYEADPRPLTWREATDQLAALQPGRWQEKRLEQVVAGLRSRLARQGVAGLGGDEPIATMLCELVRAGVVVPPDLAVLDPD
jgi:hypothetical protein